MRLVDGDALSKEAGKLWSEMPDGEELSKELMKAINHAPTVDAAPVKHGRWESVKGVALWYSRCSECGYVTSMEIRNWNYCHACGAKMDLEE